jgi:hypothetical protein
LPDGEADGVIGGYCAIGSANRAIAPVRVMASDSTDAKIGRSMKKCEILPPPFPSAEVTG